MVHKSSTVIVVAVLIIVISVCQWTVPVESARILAVSTVVSKSHWNFIGAVLGPLTEAGHHVTVFTQFPEDDRDNYTEVDTSGKFPILSEMDFAGFIEKISGPRRLLSVQMKGMREHCDIVHGDGRLGDIVKNVVEIGGIHMKPPKTIPKNILEFIEDAPHGVIFLTFGSVTKFSSLPEHIQGAFREALAQVPQKVLWKYEEEMKDKPTNVMIQKWFPQREILLHPNVKLFISHGGISGIYETVDAGVPVLGFPLFLDQPRNIEHLVYNDMAISMDLLTVTKNTLLNSISELINNEKYKKNAKINSQRFKNRPMTPQQSVVYWVEYVVRHKGAPPWHRIV